MGFMIYDLILLGIFIIFIGIFLYKRKKEIKKDGWLLLYKTSWGMKLIDKVGKKYKKTLNFSSYISVALGYLLTIGVLWMIYSVVEIYLFHPEIVSLVKVPPIMPLVPYIDKFVTFLPPFYFTYWIVILAMIAIPHEFAHGIFMRLYNIKIKSTGFGFFPFFLPVFLAAFVEQDEKSMVKAKNYEQRAVLSAGTFANTITAVVCLIVLWGFFSACFAPAGVIFDDYVYSEVGLAEITMVNGIAVSNLNYDQLSQLVENSTFNNITTEEKNFIGIKGLKNEQTIFLYDDSPAINSKLNGAIIEINNEKVTSLDELSAELGKYSGGDEIEIKTKTSDYIEHI